MMKLSFAAATALLVASAGTASAFTSQITSSPTSGAKAFIRHSSLFAESDNDSSDAVFVAPDEGAAGDDTFAKAEILGKGAAKAKRGKRKGVQPTKSSKPVAAALTPEEVFYEGPPAITETIVPTISILTVVGIIPAAAAWARQAWVRYKITSRRIRVNSGISGNEMAEIVYPDIIELRTVKRLFGDGDLVAFLRDGAKFEMRNIPNFDETMEFIADQVDSEVAATWRKKGDVTKPAE
jgi:hypothetical protein